MLPEPWQLLHDLAETAMVAIAVFGAVLRARFAVVAACELPLL
jgi:hypothetical protein